MNSEANDRDPTTGRALPGNRLAAGNRGSHPTQRRMNELRRAILESETEDDTRSVWGSLRSLAVNGDVQAIGLYLAYCWGRPTQALELSGPDGGPLGLDVASLTRIVLVALAGHPDAKLKVAKALEGAIDDEPEGLAAGGA